MGPEADTALASQFYEPKHNICIFSKTSSDRQTLHTVGYLGFLRVVVVQPQVSQGICGSSFAASMYCLGFPDKLLHAFVKQDRPAMVKTSVEMQQEARSQNIGSKNQLQVILILYGYRIVDFRGMWLLHHTCFQGF